MRLLVLVTITMGLLGPTMAQAYDSTSSAWQSIYEPTDQRHNGQRSNTSYEGWQNNDARQDSDGSRSIYTSPRYNNPRLGNNNY